jgi:hypothetical protein
MYIRRAPGQRKECGILMLAASGAAYFCPRPEGRERSARHPAPPINSETGQALRLYGINHGSL